MVESRIVDSDEAIVKIAGGSNFESDVTDLLFKGRQLQKKVLLEVLRGCHDVDWTENPQPILCRPRRR